MGGRPAVGAATSCRPSGLGAPALWRRRRRGPVPLGGDDPTGLAGHIAVRRTDAGPPLDGHHYLRGALWPGTPAQRPAGRLPGDAPAARVDDHPQPMGHAHLRLAVLAVRPRGGHDRPHALSPSLAPLRSVLLQPLQALYGQRGRAGLGRLARNKADSRSLPRSSRASLPRMRLARAALTPSAGQWARRTPAGNVHGLGYKRQMPGCWAEGCSTSPKARTRYHTAAQTRRPGLPNSPLGCQAYPPDRMGRHRPVIN